MLCVSAGNALASGNHKYANREPLIEEIVIIEGQQKVLHLQAAPVRVAVGDPEIADVTLTTTPQELLITGKKPGSTNLHIWGNAKFEPRRYRLRIDPQVIEGKFKSLVDHSGGVQGKEPNPKDMTRVDVGGSQIQADIKIVEISRTALMEAGIGLFIRKKSGNDSFNFASPTMSHATGEEAGSLLLESAAGFFPFLKAYQVVFGDSSRSWLASISLLQESGYAYILAEPSLVVMNGQTASFLAGGEFPVPVPQSGAATGAVTIQFKEFGVRLMLTPTVLDANRIVMKVAPEVSELDFTAGIQSGDVRVPALKVRRTETSIELGDGETFAISGLISQTTIANEDKLPWLGDIPVIGAFFRSKRFQKDDKELLMVVTPHIVHPLRRDASLPALPGEAYRKTDPSYSEFIFYNQKPGKRQAGIMEGFSR